MQHFPTSHPVTENEFGHTDAQAQQMMKHNQRLPEYQVGDKVLVRNYAGGQEWKTGTVLGCTGQVSYQVTVEGLVWSRHARQLLPLTSRC